MKAKVFNRSNLPGREHAHFPKGHKPWNTGTKGLTSANSTSFKKGQKPVNTTVVGDIRVRHRYNRNTPPVVWIKVAEPNKWEQLKRHNYTKHIGPIPSGMCVTHKDGNTLNCEADNLVLITRKQNMMRNHNREKASASMKEHWRIKKLYSKNKLTNEKKNMEPLQHSVNQVDRLLDEPEP